VPFTIFCIATYHKGDEFLRECRRQGCRVLLLTDETLRDADWPRDAVDEFYYVRRDMPEADIRKGIAHVARTEQIDRIVALDDFDVELGAMLREYLRIPGLDTTTARAFRDKLTMRTRARDAGIPCPAFVHVLNHRAIGEWIGSIPPPWVLKPRAQAAAIGIRTVHGADDLWRTIDALGDTQADYLLEQFVAGDVYHVDSIVYGGEPRFALVSRYATPPMAVAHQGGIFVTRTLPDADPAVAPLRERSARVLGSFGLRQGVSHTEFIRGSDGEWYFLETSARVGGAHIAEMLEASSGVNLWAEWARIEALGPDERYTVPEARTDYSGVIISLARQERPDTGAYRDPDIVWRLDRPHHAGLIVRSGDLQRVKDLLHDYTLRFLTDFHAALPAAAKPTA
jgi:biotin carboxylase